MAQLRLDSSVEVGRVALDVAVDDGSNEVGRQVVMAAVVGAGDNVDKGGKIGRQDGVR